MAHYFHHQVGQIVSAANCSGLVLLPANPLSPGGKQYSFCTNSKIVCAGVPSFPRSLSPKVVVVERESNLGKMTARLAPESLLDGHDAEDKNLDKHNPA
jgi:hypothetical protein